MPDSLKGGYFLILLRSLTAFHIDIEVQYLGLYRFWLLEVGMPIRKQLWAGIQELRNRPRRRIVHGWKYHQCFLLEDLEPKESRIEALCGNQGQSPPFDGLDLDHSSSLYYWRLLLFWLLAHGAFPSFRGIDSSIDKQQKNNSKRQTLKENCFVNNDLALHYRNRMELCFVLINLLRCFVLFH